MSVTRVDLSEPWRWACPACGSVSIRPNSGTRHTRKLRVSKTMNRAIPNFREPRAYHCVECGESFDDPVDRKESP